jgi:hypothetical protein
MKNFSFSVCVLLGTALTLGIGFANTEGDLPGKSITSNDMAAIMAGAVGPCVDNGQCQGNRPASVVCISVDGEQGLCALSAGGVPCGSCTGTTQNRVCDNTNPAEIDCTTTLTSGCCGVTSSCVSMTTDPTHPNGSCICKTNHGGGSIGYYSACTHK